MHEPYCHLWPSPLYDIFPYCLIKGMIFEKKKKVTTKCVFGFSLQLLSETILILRSNEWDMINIVHWSSCKVTVILVRFLWKLNFLDRFSKKSTNIKFHENPTSGSRVFNADGKTDGRTDMTKLIVAFRNFANARNNYDWEKISIKSDSVRGAANCNKEQNLCLPTKSRDCRSRVTGNGVMDYMFTVTTWLTQ